MPLGYKADVIKEYFINYNECLSNDFVLSDGGKHLHLIDSDIHDWRITFVDTGLTSTIGQRLKYVEPYLEGEEVFLANYTDSLTDCPLPRLLDHFDKHDKIASFLCVKPNLSFHVVSMTNGAAVNKIEHINRSPVHINGGYFTFRREIFKYIHEGEELVNEPFQRLIDQRELIAYKYAGFWGSMDTFKDKQQLDDIYSRGEAPWEVWRATKGVVKAKAHVKVAG